MKRPIKTLLLASAIAFLASPALAASVTDYPAGLAASGISGSRHNLGGFGKVLHTNATTEICAFCHTPHHSNAGPGSGPSGTGPTRHRPHTRDTARRSAAQVSVPLAARPSHVSVATTA